MNVKTTFRYLRAHHILMSDMWSDVTPLRERRAMSANPRLQKLWSGGLNAVYRLSSSINAFGFAKTSSAFISFNLTVIPSTSTP